MFKKTELSPFIFTENKKQNHRQKCAVVFFKNLLKFCYSAWRKTKPLSSK